MGPNMPSDAPPNRREPLRVAILVFPDAALGTLTGIFDTLGSLPMVATFDDAVPREPPFTVELVAAKHGSMTTAGGLALPVHRAIGDGARTDIAIVPSLLVEDGVWHTGRHPELVAWLRQVHAEGAVVCSDRKSVV